MTVLIYRTLGLGAFLTAVPAYRAVHRAFPGERVVLAAPAPLAPLVALTSAIARLAPTVELGVPRRIRGGITAVNLHGRGPESHRVLQSLRPERVVAFACREADVVGPSWVEQEHDVLRWVRLLTESGMAADPRDLLLERPRVSPPSQGATVVHPGAANPRCRWPEERFARAAADLSRRGHHVVVTGVRRERVLAERVTRRAGLPSDRNLAGLLDLGEMAALVDAARVVVCGDTGVAHLATAYATPSVVLFGPASPALWGPPADPRHRVIWHGEERRGRQITPGSVTAIGIAEVLAAVDEVLLADTERSA